MSSEKLEKNANFKKIALGIVFYNSASIIGPIIIFGAIGYFLDKALNGRHLILLSGIFIAFVVSNILIFRKASKIMAELKNFKSDGGQSGKNGYDEDDKKDK